MYFYVRGQVKCCLTKYLALCRKVKSFSSLAPLVSQQFFALIKVKDRAHHCYSKHETTLQWKCYVFFMLALLRNPLKHFHACKMLSCQTLRKMLRN